MKQRVRPEPVEEAWEGLSMVTGEEIWTSQGQNESTMGGVWWLEMQIVGSPSEETSTGTRVGSEHEFNYLCIAF